MHCPNCGTKAAEEQQFCRVCGFSLEKVSQLLAEQLSASPPNQPLSESRARLLQRQHKIERWLFILLGSVFTVFIIVVFWTIISKIIILKGELLGGIIFLGILAGLVLALLLVIYRESLREALTEPRLSRPTPLQSEPTDKLLPESSLAPIPSVAERTTELLMAEKKSSTKEI